MNPRTSEPVGDWHPVLLPPILYLNTAVLLLSSLTMEIARSNIFREIDVLEEWLGLGRPALRRTLPWVAATLFLGGAVPRRTVDGMAATVRRGICVRSVVHARKLFLFMSLPAYMPRTWCSASPH